jgi:hypothetical protein
MCRLLREVVFLPQPGAWAGAPQDSDGFEMFA